MFRAITFTDVHLADRNPGARIDSYRDAILGKLEQARDFCVQKKADVAICGGDLFHIKTPTKNSHYLVAQTIAILKSFPCPVYSVYGNHDLRQDNISTLPSQPFYTVMKSGAIEYLTEALFDNGKVRLFGMDYVNEPEDDDFNKENNGEKVQICVAHVNASSKFDDLFGERVYRYQDLCKTSPDIFVFGHYHPDQGIEVLEDTHFINVGSLCRGSLKMDELSRIPNLGYIEIDDDSNIRCEKLPLKVAPSSEIFDLELKAKEDVEQKELERFIGEMKDRLDPSSDDEDIGEVIRSSSQDFGKTIVDKAMYYYEKAL